MLHAVECISPAEMLRFCDCLCLSHSHTSHRPIPFVYSVLERRKKFIMGIKYRQNNAQCTQQSAHSEKHQQGPPSRQLVCQTPIAAKVHLYRADEMFDSVHLSVRQSPCLRFTQKQRMP